MEEKTYLLSPRTTISGTNVTVQALNTGQDVSRRAREVLITPAPLVSTPIRNPIPSSGSRPVQRGSGLIPKVLLKCASRGSKKKESKTFSIRNISPSIVTSCNALKALIRAQLGDDITEQFDIGYQTGSAAVVNIRCSDDLREVWSSIIKDTRVTLWCDGLITGGVAGSRREEYSDDEILSRPAKKKKKDSEDNAVIESFIKKLKEHHGSSYTPMQYTIWAEMYNGGVHPSLAEPPTSSMFVRVGGGNPTKKKTPNDSFTQAITQIASALSPNSSMPRTGLGTSPGKLIDNRSKCYKQLADLNNLKQSGVLNDDEYTTERGAIMQVLKKMN